MRLPIVLSTSLVFLGGLYCIAMGMIASHSMWVLWAIVPMLWAIARASARENDPASHARLYGLLILLGYIVVGSIVIYRDASRWLWWMIVVNIAVDLAVKSAKNADNH